MKIAIVSSADKRHMPMASVYFDYFESRKMNYDIIRSNRYDNIGRYKITEHKYGKEYVYGWRQSTSVSKTKKMLPYIRFREFVKKIIRRNRYDYLVIWNENTAIILLDILLHKYKNKYIVNIRDEYKNRFLTYCLDKSIKYSAFATFPSAKMVYEYKSSRKILLVYNRDNELMKYCKKKEKLRDQGKPIRITFMGCFYRAPNTFFKILDLFGNDKRYVLQFFGDGFDIILREYANQKKIENVITEGAFKYERTGYYLENTDIINSYYNNNALGLKCAAGIKESYTPMLYIPAIVDDGTYWGDISRKYGFSYLINDENIKNLPNLLYDWYYQLDFNEFRENCDLFNNIILETREKLYEKSDKLFRIIKE